MTFFLSFLQSKITHPIPAYSFWEYYIKNGIEESGYQWTENPDIDWAEGLVYQENSIELNIWKAKTWEKTLESIKNHRPSIFLSYLYPKQIDISAIGEIQKLGIPCVNFFCDHVREFKSLPKEFYCFNLNWVPEIEALHLYKKKGLNHIHLPMPMWVSPDLRYISETFNQDIAFIGSRDLQRTLLFNELLSNNQNNYIKIYGKGWLKDDVYVNKFQKSQNFKSRIKNQIKSLAKNGITPYLRYLSQRNLIISPSEETYKCSYGTISFKEYIKITKSSYITLGVNRYPNIHYPLTKPHTYSRLRDIEAPMLGACYITENAPDLKYFYPNDEMQTYSSVSELNEKINLLKSYNTNERLNYIKTIQNIAINELSIPKSINKLINKL